jgi:hypothetical protein
MDMKHNVVAIFTKILAFECQITAAHIIAEPIRRMCNEISEIRTIQTQVA